MRKQMIFELFFSKLTRFCFLLLSCARCLCQLHLLSLFSWNLRGLSSLLTDGGGTTLLTGQGFVSPATPEATFPPSTMITGPFSIILNRGFRCLSTAGGVVTLFTKRGLGRFV